MATKWIGSPFGRFINPAYIPIEFDEDNRMEKIEKIWKNAGESLSLKKSENLDYLIKGLEEDVIYFKNRLELTNNGRAFKHLSITQEMLKKAKREKNLRNLL